MTQPSSNAQVYDVTLAGFKTSCLSLLRTFEAEQCTATPSEIYWNAASVLNNINFCVACKTHAIEIILYNIILYSISKHWEKLCFTKPAKRVSWIWPFQPASCFGDLIGTISKVKIN